MVSYTTNVWYNLSCLLQTYYRLSIIENLFVSWQFFETYGVINYGSGRRTDIVKEWLEFAPHPVPVGTCKCSPKLQALVYDILPLEEGAGKRCSECGYDCGSNLAPKHPPKHETHPPRVKKKKGSSVSIQTILVLFVLAQATWSVRKETSGIIWVVRYKFTAFWAPTKNCPLADSFSRPMA